MQEQNQPLDVGTDYTSMFQVDGFWADQVNMKAWARYIGKVKNMVFVINRSWKNKMTGLGTFRLVCDKYGGPRESRDVDLDFAPASGRRGRSTKLGCEFELEGRQNDVDNWTINVVCGVHNHKLSDTMFGHPYAGRLTPAQHQKVRRDTMIGIRPREVLRGMKYDDSDCVTDIRQVYNARAKLKRSAAEGRRDLPQALHQLHQKGYYIVTRKSSEAGGNEVTDVILAHPDSRHLLMLFPYVIVMDTTYKTNE